MHSLLSSNLLQIVYGVFALSWLPYIVLRIYDMPWVYSLFYRGHGIMENMTVVFYGFAAFFAGTALVRAQKTHRVLWAVFLVAIFMLGEEIRWGFAYLANDIHDFRFTSVQDFLQWLFNAIHIPQGWALILGLVAIVLTLRFRHVVQDFYERERGTVFYALSSIYIVFLGVAVFIEFTLQPGKNVLDVLEETLEMNASFVWMLLALTVRDFVLQRPRPVPSL